MVSRQINKLKSFFGTENIINKSNVGSLTAREFDKIVNIIKINDIDDNTFKISPRILIKFQEGNVLIEDYV